MPRYIDADKALEFIKETNANYHWLLAQYNAQWVYDFIESQPTADVIPKSEVERLEKALADKARECNMAVDKICLAHREEIRALQEKHEAELAAAKREVARKIFAELDKMDIRIVRVLDAIKYMDLVKKYEYKNN